MTIAIGIAITDHIVAGRLEEQQLTGKVLRYPNDEDAEDALTAIPCGELVELLAANVATLAGAGEGPVDAIGVAVPGIVRHGVVEDSPNLPQIKGMRLAEELSRELAGRGIHAPVSVVNDADAIAASVAATHGRFNKLTRVWTIGNGIGYGRWPYVEGVWEGGHITVTLDPKEKFCGCGGVGHLEGIMGSRASAAGSLWICGIARWPRRRLLSSTWPAPDGSTSPGTTCTFWSCHCCAAIWNRWCG
jgi:predicted NBD/HSP70 family sugar kinase